METSNTPFLSKLDTILTFFFPGRAEAKIAARSRQPTLTSDHFIQQYFLSFAEDPIMNRVKREKEEEKESGETENGDHSKR